MAEQKTIGQIAFEAKANFLPAHRRIYASLSVAEPWEKQQVGTQQIEEAAASAVWNEAVEACITECFHQEQLQVWSDEFLSELAAIGHVNPDTSYDDVVDMHRRFQEFLKHTVVSRICSIKRSPSPTEETDV